MQCPSLSLPADLRWHVWTCFVQTLFISKVPRVLNAEKWSSKVWPCLWFQGLDCNDYCCKQNTRGSAPSPLPVPIDETGMPLGRYYLLSPSPVPSSMSSSSGNSLSPVRGGVVGTLEHGPIISLSNWEFWFSKLWVQVDHRFSFPNHLNFPSRIYRHLMIWTFSRVI